MTIQNLIRLINAKLINEPSISSVDDFTFNLKDVKPKSAFIAINASDDDVEKAIEMGAYAIIFDSSFKITNKEIAYIKVENLNNALFKLMRFVVALKNLKFVFVSNLQMSILKHCTLSNNIIFASQSDDELFVKVMNAKNKDIFLSEDIDVVKKITSAYEELGVNLDAKVEFESSIFYLNFCYKDEYYKLNCPQLFLPQIYGILEFIDKNEANIKFKDLRNLEHFEPIFVDRFYNLRNHGDSYRAFIIESDKELFEEESRYLKSKFKEGIITISYIDDDLQTDMKYTNLEDLKVPFNFRYALVLGDKNEILKMLKNKEEPKTLFDF